MFRDLNEQLKTHKVFHEMLTNRVKPDFLTYYAMLETYKELSEKSEDEETNKQWFQEGKARERSMLKEGINWNSINVVTRLQRYLRDEGQEIV